MVALWLRATTLLGKVEPMIRCEQTWLLVCFFSLELSGCSGSSSSSQGTGGNNSVEGTSDDTSAAGGAAAAGSKFSSGGSSVTTATQATASGGANTLEGSTNSSDVNTMVSIASGGSMPTGGTRGAGGTTSTAGASNLGGTKDNGSAAGGTSSTGGSKAAGVFALNADTGATLSGWPVDLNSKVPTTGGTSFNSLVQNQRGALAMLGGKVFVPFGGHIGDCGNYRGWVVGIATTDPTQVSAWATRAIAGGIWAPGGIASDGTSLFVVTGNTEVNPNNFTPPSSWQDGEAIFRLAPSLAPVTQSADYYVPTNWSTMDQGDQDLGGTNALVVDVPGATPSSLVIALGKDGKAYAVNRANLGGISAGTSVATVAVNAIITAPAAYATSSGSFVVFKGNGSGCPSGQSGGLTAIKIGATSPPSISVAWCGGPATNDSPAVSMSSAQGQDAIVWIVGTDNKLHGLDANTGTSVYAGGTGSDTMSSVQTFETPIVANGRVFVAANNQVYAFTP
jgi:hypothetical protein